MTQIYCAFQDCEYYENGLCSAAAIRISPDEGCLTYTPFESGHTKEDTAKQGDQLTWDEEYFEYELLDDDITT